MKEEIIKSLIVELVPKMERADVDVVTAHLRIILDEYEIKKKSKELVVYEGDVNEQIIKKFLAVKMVQGCSPETIKAYGEYLSFIARKINNKPIVTMTSDDILSYLARRKMRDGITETSQDNELRVLRSFFSWAEDEELVRKNPCKKIQKIRGKKKVKEAFTENELELMRAVCRKGKSAEKFGSKHLAILETLISTGCRATECVNIKLEDIKGDRIKILGKGNKERYVYLTARAQVAIKEYLNTRTYQSPYLFTGYDVQEKKETEKMSSGGSINTIVKNIAKRAGIESAHAHKFRRTAATLAMKRGMPIELVSKMLGHEQLSTTQIYLQITDDDVASAHNKYVG